MDCFFLGAKAGTVRRHINTECETRPELESKDPGNVLLARQARIQGSVLLQAQISKEGTIEHLTLISGHPMLAPAAIEAVKQWRYKPYILNGEPVEVDTQITVNFTLSGG